MFFSTLYKQLCGNCDGQVAGLNLICSTVYSKPAYSVC